MELTVGGGGISRRDEGILVLLLVPADGALARVSGLLYAAVAQLVERVLGKDEVMGPSPISSSMQACQAPVACGIY